MSDLKKKVLRAKAVLASRHRITLRDGNPARVVFKSLRAH
jgi:hypothetical protein